MYMNKYIIRNTNLLLNCEAFFEKFIEIIILLLLNFFSDYNQMKLHLNSQNMTVFMTSLKLLHQITLSMRVTNLSAQFSQEIIQMLDFNISYNTEVFIDDIKIKKSKIKYNNEENFSEIQHFILEHLQMLDHILLILKLTNVKISEEKSHFD